MQSKEKIHTKRINKVKKNEKEVTREENQQKREGKNLL